MSSERTPQLRRHKTHGLGVVTLNGRDHYLGKWPDGKRKPPPEVQAEYDRLIAEWLAAGRCQIKLKSSSTEGVSINELLLAYWIHAEQYYRKNGEPTSQLDRVRLSLKPVKALYGLTAARDFGPLALKAVRERMIQQGGSRGYINACVGCIKRMFKWGVADELIPSSVYHGLLAVEGLKKGRTKAPERRKVRPVADQFVDVTLPFMTPPVRAMVQLQRLSGMRPGEVVIMRPCDIDRSKSKIWVYRPDSHKTEHHDIERVVILGPQAQEVLRPFLVRDPGVYCFSPREAIQEFRIRQRKGRKTPLQPSQFDRRRKRPKKQPGDRYRVDTYNHSVGKALERLNHGRWCVTCKEALKVKRKAAGKRNVHFEPCEICKAKEIPHWHVHQLRHSLATEVRREAGLDAARVILGHRSPQITDHYAELDKEKAEQVMERIG